MKQVFLLLSIVIAYSFVGCSSEDGDRHVETIKVASKRVTSNMEYGNPYLIMRQGDADWSLLYDPIQGFDYEEGYEYLIQVEVWNVEHPITDQYIKNYKLLEVLSKEKKDSNVPLFLSEDTKSPLMEGYVSDGDINTITLPNGIVLGKDDSLYIYSGDIIMTWKEVEEKLLNITRSDVNTVPSKYWHSGNVHYIFDNGFSKSGMVQQAIAHWESKTCIRFYYGTGSGNYIIFKDGSGNYSNSIGMKGGEQQIVLSSYCSVGNIIHEIGHAIGLEHEQCRQDRDSYISILWNNIENGYSSQFQMSNSSNYQDVGTFDFGSVMLYSSDAFALPGTYSMLHKNTNLAFSAQRDSLSTGDVEGVKSIYGPPFHKVDAVRSYIDDYHDNITDYSEYEETHKIHFYTDRTYIHRVTNTYPRRIEIINDRQFTTYTGGPIEYQRAISTVWIPANTYEYSIGTFHNINWEEYSNPYVVDITTIGLGM